MDSRSYTSQSQVGSRGTKIFATLGRVFRDVLRWQGYQWSSLVFGHKIEAEIWWNLDCQHYWVSRCQLLESWTQTCSHFLLRFTACFWPSVVLRGCETDYAQGHIIIFEYIYIHNLGLNEHDSVFIENCATSLTWTEYERAIKSGILWRSYSSSANSLVIGTQHKVSLKALAWKADFRLKVLLIMISFYCQGIELTTVPRDAWFWDSDLLPSSKVYGNGECLGS